MASGKAILTVLTVISSLTTAALAVAGAISDHNEKAQKQQLTQDVIDTTGFEYQYHEENMDPIGANYQPKQMIGYQMKGDNSMQFMTYQNPYVQLYNQVSEQLMRSYPEEYIRMMQRGNGWASLDPAYQSQFFGSGMNLNDSWGNTTNVYPNQYNNGYYPQYNAQPQMYNNQYGYTQTVQNVQPQYNQYNTGYGYGYGYADNNTAPVQPVTQPQQYSQPVAQDVQPQMNQNPYINNNIQKPVYDYGYGYSDPTADYFQNQYQAQNSVDNYGYATSNQYNTGYGYGYGYDDNTVNNVYGYNYNNSNNNNNWYNAQPQMYNNQYGYTQTVQNVQPRYNQNPYNNGYTSNGYGYGYGYADNSPQYPNQSNGYGGYGNVNQNPYGTYNPSMMEPGTPAFNHFANVLFGDSDYSGYNRDVHQQQIMYANRREAEARNRQQQQYQYQMQCRQQQAYMNQNPYNNGYGNDAYGYNDGMPHMRPVKVDVAGFDPVRYCQKHYGNGNGNGSGRHQQTNPGNPDYVQ